MTLGPVGIVAHAVSVAAAARSKNISKRRMALFLLFCRRFCRHCLPAARTFPDIGIIALLFRAVIPDSRRCGWFRRFILLDVNRWR